MENEITLNRFIFYGEWLDSINDLPLDIQDKIIGDIVRYGTDTERKHTDDQYVSMAVNFTKGAIDRSKDEYMKKILGGKNYGRKKTVDDKVVYEMANKGMKSADIANTLGVSKSSIDHCEGWKKRKTDGFSF